jgi:hypothetical protein
MLAASSMARLEDKQNPQPMLAVQGMDCHCGSMDFFAGGQRGHWKVNRNVPPPSGPVKFSCMHVDGACYDPSNSAARETRQRNKDRQLCPIVAVSIILMKGGGVATAPGRKRCD